MAHIHSAPSDNERGSRSDAQLLPRRLQRGGEGDGGAKRDQMHGRPRQPAVPALAVALHQEERLVFDLSVLRRAVLALRPGRQAGWQGDADLRRAGPQTRGGAETPGSGSTVCSLSVAFKAI